jgi:hypothetical protein
VVAQHGYVEMLHYQHRLRGFFGRRNAAQFQGQVPLDRAPVAGAATAAEANEASLHQSYGASIDATTAIGRATALEALAAESQNSNERGWLRFGIGQTRQPLAPAPP